MLEIVWKKKYDMLCQLGRRHGKGGDGNVTWLLCWTDSCTIGLIASSRSLIIVMAVSESCACAVEIAMLIYSHPLSLMFDFRRTG